MPEQMDPRAEGVQVLHLRDQGGEQFRRRAGVAGRRVMLVVARHQHHRPPLREVQQRREPPLGMALVEVPRAGEHVEVARGRRDQVEAPPFEMQVGERKDAHGRSHPAARRSAAAARRMSMAESALRIAISPAATRSGQGEGTNTVVSPAATTARLATVSLRAER